MKNQYFGEINDYLKYRLLRRLTGYGEVTTAVCWMLTPDDDRADGRFIEYLKRPERWQHYDPELFDVLRELVVARGARDVALAGEANLLPAARFYAETLSDDAESRARYFEDLWRVARGCDLIFFDPDNGIEARSKPCGRKGSSKYLYWKELVSAYSEGYSVLVYQHSRREKRDDFIVRMAGEIRERTGVPRVYSFRTPRVVFFLAPAVCHVEVMGRNAFLVSESWGSQIRVKQHG
jgi:hypothetical protein